MSVRLSIITINYNNAGGLSKTMTSVLKQTYNSIEYIVIDGGSDDGSLEIMEKHASALAYSVSEKDNGIYPAMNKGIDKATGEYFLFLNSGDFLKTEVTISNCFQKGITADIVYGNIESAGRVINYPAVLDFTFFFRDSIPHPASFIRRSVFETVGKYNENNKIVSDWEFFLKVIIGKKASYAHINETVTVYDTTGLSADPAFAALQNKERVEVLTPYIDEQYPALLQSITNMENELNLYKNSRLISTVKKILNSNFSASLKNKAGRR